MNINIIEQTLREFADYFLEVGGVVLVSAEGQLMTSSIGIEENTTKLVAGTFLQVLNQIAQHCAWQKAEQVFLEAKEGYLIMLPCTEEAFILIKTNCIPSGTLKREIQQIATKLETLLNPRNSSSFYPLTSSLIGVPENPDRANSSKLDLQVDPTFVLYCQQQLAEFIGPIASLLCQRILKQNPHLYRTDLVEALAQKIPNSGQAQEFRKRISSWDLNSTTNLKTKSL